MRSDKIIMTLYHKSGWHEALELAALISSSSTLVLAELMTDEVAVRWCWGLYGLKLASLGTAAATSLMQEVLRGNKAR